MFGKKKGAGGSAVLYASKKKKFSERLRFSFSHHYELYLLALPTLMYIPSKQCTFSGNSEHLNPIF